jgi:hypothetical protein
LQVYEGSWLVGNSSFITINRSLDAPTLYGGDRPDVALALGNPDFEFSGFIATFSSSILPKGQYTISLKIVALALARSR